MTKPNPIPSNLSVQQIEHFWERVEKSNENQCWPWNGATNHKGYGRLLVYTEGVAHYLLAHRLAFYLSTGTVREGLFICHHCDNPPCCNPSHLFSGSLSDNAMDMVNKGRHGLHLHPERAARGLRHSSQTHPEKVVRGESAPWAKLSESTVLEIRKEYNEGRISQSALARRYEVSQALISCVVTRKSWSHL